MRRWEGLDSVRDLAQPLLGAGTDRFRHVAGVAGAVGRVSGSIETDDVQLVVAAAWLHDIGYASEIAGTGFHPLDGARYLREMGAPERLCGLVANHTASHVEAEARGLLNELLEEFPPEDSAAADALTFADLTTGPTGEGVTVEDRLAEIFERYPANHVVHGAIQRATPQLLATVRRVEDRLSAASQPR